MKRKLISFCAAFFFIDRMTKLGALSLYKEPFEVNSYLSFWLTYNRGVSFSFFSSDSLFFFIALSLFILLITLSLAAHTYKEWLKNNTITGELLVLIGSFSNLLDRFFYGAVIDFILFHYKEWSFAIFNIADIGIVLGVALMAYHTLSSQE